MAKIVALRPCSVVELQIGAWKVMGLTPLENDLILSFISQHIRLTLTLYQCTFPTQFYEFVLSIIFHYKISCLEAQKGQNVL